VARRVTTPDGTVWTIRRLWFRSPRWRGRGYEDDSDDLGLEGLLSMSAGVDDSITGSLVGPLFVAFAFVIATVLFAVFLPLVVFVGELLLLPLLVFAFGDPCTVEVRNTATGESSRVTVRGWRKSGALADAWAKRLARGETTPKPSVELVTEASRSRR
jgi:hypothetical protein